MGATVSEVQPAALKFSDSAACKTWVRGLPLTNVVHAQAEILDQVRRLNESATIALERFKILELMREPAVFVQTELAKKFSNKPLPLAEVERRSFQSVIELWSEMAAGYRLCVEACNNISPEDKETPKHIATMCHRVLASIASAMTDFVRANHQFPDSYWTDLHAAFRHAEHFGVTEEKVPDPTSRERSERTCTGAYVAPILLVLANPHESLQRHIGMVSRWLERWADKTTISKTAPEATDKPPLLVDLASAKGAYRNAEPGAEPRWINIDVLSHTMKKRVHYLRKGQSPAELFLSEECVQPACEALLVLLYQHWCDGREARAHARKSVAAKSQACSGFEAMHYYISGVIFKQPDEKSEIAKHHRDEIATFGQVGKREEEMHSLIHGYVVENWTIENETVAGLRLVRPAGNTGARLSPLQLIAVRPQDSKGFMLAVVRWVAMMGDDLAIGVRLLPGTPEAIGVRPTGINARNEKFQQAFAMPSVPALQSQATIVLPPAWFKRDKVIEIHTIQIAKVKLIDSVERGFDSERVTFIPA
jgi:cyclic-di-GMP-binding protein